ncbi:hypothetical protein ONS95_008729 [Cadophora gregata]|uniref:uncharacterized protein n=1 Tax=Cadophora gregata TaxID=51156 RepID=UPI0026DDB227|nr:uncharacterized protein ONS95_008729 [Cadophora gregata]KAK0123720.1 hypothetical protein ONS95_008729 [Cadophora gregata]KAK0130062.1 hypothetical protein ONS96_000599 [Cadophora gregata f. sp. sojae]
MPSSKELPDYYHVFGLSRDFTETEIKIQHRRLAFQHHPDKNPNNPNATAYFQLINAAAEVLTDPVTRRYYHNQYDKQQVETASQRDKIKAWKGWPSADYGSEYTWAPPKEHEYTCKIKCEEEGRAKKEPTGEETRSSPKQKEVEVPEFWEHVILDVPSDEKENRTEENEEKEKKTLFEDTTPKRERVFEKRQSNYRKACTEDQYLADAFTGYFYVAEDDPEQDEVDSPDFWDFIYECEYDSNLKEDDLNMGVVEKMEKHAKDKKEGRGRDKKAYEE